MTRKYGTVGLASRVTSIKRDYISTPLDRQKYQEKKYNLTSEEYTVLLHEVQNGKCAVCHRVPPKRGLVIDHDHDTGMIRGLLCPACNNNLVSCHTLKTLKLVWTYLRKPPVLSIPIYIGRKSGNSTSNPRKYGSVGLSVQGLE